MPLGLRCRFPAGLRGRSPAGREYADGAPRRRESADTADGGAGRPATRDATGTSMDRAKVDRRIIDRGDLFLVHQQRTAVGSDTLVPLVDGEATVRRLVAAPGYYNLETWLKGPHAWADHGGERFPRF